MQDSPTKTGAGACVAASLSPGTTTGKLGLFPNSLFVPSALNNATKLAIARLVLVGFGKNESMHHLQLLGQTFLASKMTPATSIWEKSLFTRIYPRPAKIWRKCSTHGWSVEPGWGRAPRNSWNMILTIHLPCLVLRLPLFHCWKDDIVVAAQQQLKSVTSVQHGLRFVPP